MMISSNPKLTGGLLGPLHPGEVEGGFLIPAPPETWTQRQARAAYVRWLRAKWWWRRNVRPLS